MPTVCGSLSVLRALSLLGMAGFALGLPGCGGSTAQPGTPVNTKGGLAQTAKGLGDSRCDAQGRSDRASVTSRALGSESNSIQRVFATGANTEDGQRVLRCREVDTNLDGVVDLIRTYTDEGEPLVEQADANYDGKIDTWVTFARGRVAHLERDVNTDGKPDVFEVYSQGKLTKVQRDTNLDGKLDTWEVYENGRLNRIGVDLNNDEKVDRWYRDAELVRREQQEAEAERAEEDAAEAEPAQTDAEPAQ